MYSFIRVQFIRVCLIFYNLCLEVCKSAKYFVPLPAELNCSKNSMGITKKYDVFLSSKSEDYPIAREICSYI